MSKNRGLCMEARSASEADDTIAEVREEIIKDGPTAGGARRIEPHALRDGILAAALCLFSVLTVAVPIYRAFHNVEVSYNEGWNVYAAADLAHHVPLYPTRYGWTTVNYPPLSFLVIEEVTHHAHDYLLAGRMISLVSLLLDCILVGMIAKRAGCAGAPSFLAGCFCLAILCAQANSYIAMDDPQMFAQVLFLTGMLMYMSGKPRSWRLAAIAILFALGGSIKQNLLAFPLAVLIDLYLTSWRRCLEFLAYGCLFLAAAILIDIHIGGPYLMAKLLMPRPYSLAKAGEMLLEHYGLILLPLVAAVKAMAVPAKNTALRTVSIWFVLSLAEGLVFAGGAGVSVNAFLSNFLSLSVLVGIFIDSTRKQSVRRERHGAWLWAGVPAILFGSLLLPLQVYVGMKSALDPAAIRIEQAQFDREVNSLRAQPGPALCESLLRCYEAGKPYVYDPFNSTNLILLGKLDGEEVVSRIRNQEYGAVQLNSTVNLEPRPSNRFVRPILDAVSQYYAPLLEEPGCVIYIPRRTGQPIKDVDGKNGGPRYSPAALAMAGGRGVE